MALPSARSPTPAPALAPLVYVINLSFHSKYVMFTNNIIYFDLYDALSILFLSMYALSTFLIPRLTSSPCFIPSFLPRGPSPRPTLQVAMRLEIDVVEVQWTAEPCSLRVMGVVTNETEHVHRGQHHTFEIAHDTKLRLYKKNWELRDSQRLRMAVDPTQGATLAAVVVEPGLAHVCIVSSQMTVVKARVEQSIPKKRPSGPSGHDTVRQMTRISANALLYSLYNCCYL